MTLVTAVARVCVAGFFLALSPKLGLGQAVCTDSNDFAAGEISYLVAMANSTDSATVAGRQSMAIPRARQAQIALVRDPGVCARAGAAYARAERDRKLTGGRAPRRGDSTLGKVVHVFRVADRYLVADEQNMAGEFAIMWVFDRTFATPLKRLGI